MTGKTVGYIRVSHFDQNPERQLEGIKLDKKFIDKASGKDINRPALEELIGYVREDDIIIIHSMDRLARNLDDLRKIVKTLTLQKVQIKFLKENLIFAGDDSPMANLLLSVMGAFAEFERSLIKERQMEGISLAKKKGLYKGRTAVLNQEQLTLLQSKISLGIPKAKIARELNISRRTLYNYILVEPSKSADHV
ncbi:Site-specific DNA recombinase family protein (plasmid) [Candidatus Trichorickettsia mobilis]|uniref:recombinase family protein n=1 Tax=Candidatus Trichorickettsia mobilis TaxID=1346319 RepID=UPI002B26437B|nr:recombinase family protein [Candidatus Trichorickettsia mobilis]WPY01662.1 Site-specific DNA recombinase family protein [Candidatus Trichorickettsia mobilis]